MLLLDDDLSEHRARYVFSAFRVICDKITAILDHLCEIVEGDVGARRRIVETAVGVLFDDHRFRVACRIAARGAHVRGFSPPGWSPRTTIQRINGSIASKTRRRHKDRSRGRRSSIYSVQ